MTIIRKFESEAQDKNSPKKYISLIGVILLCLIVLEIWASNTIANFGEKFAKISNLEKTLQMGNQVLKNQIAKESSLNTLASKSAEFGFSKHESIQYIR